ncbi:unnamed protein product [Sphagnum jensenii]|uniref:Uncharacterized protein n=1 Tax=Sphagnum jensenii TaxID=128206 RepID=A0ABP1ATI2_9BRYO
MMLLRSVSGVAAATPYPAAPALTARCSLCHSSSSSPSTSFSNVQYGSSKAFPSLQGNRMMRPVAAAALKDNARTPFLIGHEPLRFTPVNCGVRFEKKKASSSAIDAGKSGADAYSQGNSNPEAAAEESITENNATDKKQNSSSRNFDFSNAQGHSEDAARKALGILREITSQLLEQAEKARSLLAASAQELPIRGKENLSYVAENGPEPVKDIVETALNAHYPESSSVKPGSKIHDFCLGIPYGVLLVVGGLLQFILTGSTAAIRFGVVLGGLLLALTVTSLKAWKQGESSLPYIQGQAIITLAIFFRFIRRYGETNTFFPTGIVAITSAAMLAFYVYVFLSGGNPPKKIKSESSY